MPPADQATVIVQSRFQTMDIDRAIASTLDIVLAGPLQLEGRFVPCLLPFFGISPIRTPNVNATNRPSSRFQNDLAGSKPPGFVGATSLQIEAVPWLSDLPGYEDCYLLGRRSSTIR
jgi:hypothetical protein